MIGRHGTINKIFHCKSERLGEREREREREREEVEGEKEH